MPFFLWYNACLPLVELMSSSGRFLGLPLLGCLSSSCRLLFLPLVDSNACGEFHGNVNIPVNENDSNLGTPPLPSSLNCFPFLRTTFYCRNSHMKSKLRRTVVWKRMKMVRSVLVTADHNESTVILNSFEQANKYRQLFVSSVS